MSTRELMQTIQIIKKDVTRIKLTVTPERISMKFPLNTSDEVVDKITPAFLQIAVLNKDTPFTIRGDLRANGLIRMCVRNKNPFTKGVTGVYYDTNNINNILDARPVSSVLLQ